MPHPIFRFAAAFPLAVALAACGGDGTAPVSPLAAVDAGSAGAAPGNTANAGSSAGTPSPTTPASTPGKWKNTRTGDMLDVALGELRPTQGALGYDQIYYKLGRYERQPDKKFDDFCADEGLGGIAPDGYTAQSTLRDAASYACATSAGARDRTVLNPVVIGPNGDTLYVTDGHHGLSTYYETPDGGAALRVHVVVKDNLGDYSGAAFWQQMQRRGYTRLKDGDGRPIAPDQLPAGLGLKLGMQDDRYRSLVYFTRDIGYAKPAQATDYLEFYWADWLRQQPETFSLAGYDLARAGATDPDPANADTGYLNAVWNASARMVASTDPVIDGKTGADLGRADQINGGKKYSKGEFDKLRQPITADKPGKIAYALDYRSRHGLR
ncbi:ParB/Srx family N-terminal domain-containing protein [Burkholderia thailandensis]|uniref:ParB/Srx family N-terminal domain-containing protein n=1 Tax=Burkholderia thailandensis TaxID=57975 RepID=UPI0005DA4868|nr:ParB/Srx family N-terminal domain-containing protein [Burkholderia thailandensis]AJY29529.1 parB-like nuclease family protein [Burkholderia thailandensis 34]AOJ57832.1 chromosome partitioning protein ParB [Burkholderia thailandensis]KXF61283.1 chromosome partitioning protein ParB [Burkholderia thailandensis]MCZ2898258.1 ParB/Srx family N-terminal domain-containing protein [Burkholderia thailandensis]MDD1478938.1 chromosome partitioning protein ParB [Burkholderia thailandensis]